MTTQDNDTLKATQRNSNKSQVTDTKGKEAMVAKLLASAAVGMIAGAGATYAADYFKDHTEEASTEPTTVDTQAQVDNTEQQSTEPTVEERLSKLEEKERIREQEESRMRHNAERNPQPQQHEAEKPVVKKEDNQQEQKQESEIEQKPAQNKPQSQTVPAKDEQHTNEDIFKNHDVKIESVQEHTLDDGTTVHVYTGSIDGHQAMFMDDGYGRIISAIVDANDNGEADDNEVIDLRPFNVTDQQLAVYRVSEPTHEVNVVAVEHNVDMGGDTVDVAVVSMDEEQVVLVDVNQNAEVDLVIADRNHNEVIEEDEVQDVSNSHIAMPTEDDIATDTENINASDETEDYSNNADTTLYDL